MKLTLTLLILIATFLEVAGFLLGNTLFPLAFVLFGLAILIASLAAVYAFHQQWE